MSDGARSWIAPWRHGAEVWPPEVQETMATERRLIEDARRRGTLTKASPEGNP